MSTTTVCSPVAEHETSVQGEFEQLRRALAVAEAASQAKSVLVAKLGHELKAPLNAIVGLAQLTRMRCGREPQPAAVADWLDQIARLGWHMADVVDTLMELGPFGAGSLRAGSETFDVLESMTEALRTLESDVTRRGITVSFAGDVHAPVTADRRALRQVFVNLLSNAVKYNKEGGNVCLSVRGGERVRITVHDTGPGLTGGQCKRLFQAFDRLGAEHSGVEGHGLGLMLCRELLQAMGGSIEAQAAEGAGCTFIVTLPGAAAHASGLPDFLERDLTSR